MKNKKCKGMTLIEITVAIAILVIMTVSGISLYGMTDRAKVARVRSDFSVLRVVSTQLLQEHSGLGRINTSKFYLYFNQYIDSIDQLDDDNETIQKKDPWGKHYTIEFNQISGSETTITISSTGKEEGKISFQLLVHYKNGEIRTGTAGFAENDGEDYSDAATDEDGVASITTMWAVK